MFHFKSWLMVTPSNLALVTNSRGLPFKMIMFVFSGSFLYFLLPEQFNNIQLLSSQWSSCSAGILCMDVEGEPPDPCAHPDGFLIAELFKESF